MREPGLMQPSDRRKRSSKASDGLPRGACVVCGLSDARQLATIALKGGETAVLCGSHALHHGRTGASARSVAELKTSLGERRSTSRRGTGEVDELAERLTAAFTRERRTAERRMG